jgi:hypothetical protein
MNLMRLFLVKTVVSISDTFVVRMYVVAVDYAADMEPVVKQFNLYVTTKMLNTLLGRSSCVNNLMLLRVSMSGLSLTSYKRCRC